MTTTSPSFYRRLLLATAIVLPCAVAAILLTRQPADAANAAAAFQNNDNSVGVVDVAAAIRGSNLGQQLEAEGSTRLNEFRTQMEQLQQRAQAESTALAELAEGTDQYNETAARIRRLRAEAQMLEQLANTELQVFNRDGYLRVYDQMTAALQTVAQERGLAVIIRKNEQELPENYRSMNPQQLGQALATQTVLYVSPGADITNEVIQRMNAGNGGEGQAPQAPAAGE